MLYSLKVFLCNLLIYSFFDYVSTNILYFPLSKNSRSMMILSPLFCSSVSKFFLSLCNFAGNKAMQSKLYNEAIELYSFAIAQCEDNAVYYCNRCDIVPHTDSCILCETLVVSELLS